MGRLKHLLKTTSELELADIIAHSENAAKNEIDLLPLATFLIHVPEAEIKLLQKNQLAALDLPLKISLFKNSKNQVYFSYSPTEFLSSRYDLGRHKSLRKFKNLLTHKIEKAAGNNSVNPGRIKLESEEGIVSVQSEDDFNTTQNRLIKNITAVPDLKLFKEIDYCKMADSAGLGLRPTMLFIFGNPAVGSVLMQENPQIGLELPVKILLWRDEAGKVVLSYNDPAWLAKRFRIDTDLKELGKMTALLRKITTSAAKAEDANSLVESTN
jgi:uncharacterized protein (DUF302 family)